MQHQRIIAIATVLAIAIGALVMTSSPAWAPAAPPNNLVCTTPCVDGSEIVNSTITNADVSATAAIAASKLAGSVVTTGENVSQLVNDAGYITQATGGGALIVSDSLGTDFGLFISFQSDLAWVAVDWNGQLYSLRLRAGQYDTNIATRYESTDCTGTPYYIAGNDSIAGLFKVALVLLPGNSLYVQSRPPESVNYQSRLIGGSCGSSIGAATMIPLELVRDLDASFTPPFSVQ